jgi:hypothetical protein
MHSGVEPAGFEAGEPRHLAWFYAYCDKNLYIHNVFEVSLR